MKTINPICHLTLLIAFSSMGCVSEELPHNRLTNYNLSKGIQDSIFTAKVLKKTGNLEDFLEIITANGMTITEGSSPPPVYSDIFKGDFGIRYTTQNYCIYDNKNPSNEEKLYGDYNIEILINNEPGMNNSGKLEYVSKHMNDSFQPTDVGSGTGFGSGNGENFTLFILTDNAKYNNIPYDALWIISGTYNYLRLTNFTTCFMILEKGKDPEDLIANPGTIRIFRDDNPTFIRD